MKVRIDEIREKCENILVKKGLEKNHAKIIVDEYIEGEIRGKKSHGLLAFPSIVGKIETISGKWKVEKETESMIYVDANGYFGSVVAKYMIDKLTKKAEKNGIAMCVVKNVMTWLRPQTSAKMIAENNMIGIVVNNGGKAMTAPYGGIDPIFGTNPIGIGIPTKEGMINFDMATSKRAWGEVKVAKALGNDLPKDCFLTKKGEIAKNPDDAYSAISFGDYKGYGLALLIEILTGSLVNMPMGSRGDSNDYRTSTRGALIIVINPSTITDLDKFKEENSELINKIHESRKLEGIDKILVPGESAQEKRKKALDSGYIEIDDAVIERIDNL